MSCCFGLIGGVAVGTSDARQVKSDPVRLTGGAVLLEGTTELAEEILGMPVRIGMPTGIGGITQAIHGPGYATGVGLVKYGVQQVLEAQSRAAAPPAHSVTRMTAAGVRKIDERIIAAAHADGDPKSSRLWEWIKAAF